MTGILNALLGFLKPGGAGFTIIQTFTSSTTWICPAGVTEVEYLVVAGGGGSAGAGNLGSTAGGGGGGGFRTGTAFAVVAGTSYTITVGAGGAAGSNGVDGGNGNDSVFSTITSTGAGLS